MNLKDTLARADCWTLKPALISLIAVSAIVFVCELPGLVSFVLIPLSALSYMIAALVILMVATYCVIRKRPRRGASVFLVLILPVLLWQPLCWVADVAHLGLTVGFGAGQLGSEAESRDDSFVTYDWSVGFAGANTFLIHDATDEINLPMAQHTRPPRLNGFEQECAGNVQRLIKHYYICNF